MIVTDGQRQRHRDRHTDKEAAGVGVGNVKEFIA